MSRPGLDQLPPPPAGKAGWPWTAAGTLAPPAGAAEEWPRITVVTPSFNQGSFVEETIRSVLLQGYPNLEYIVVDGGSTDQSVAVIERYAPWLSFWVSEQDRGQSHALSKGFARATGELMNWLNSDDLLRPGALATIGAAARANPGAIIAGDVIRFGPGVRGDPRKRQRGLTRENLVKYWTRAALYQQPGFYFPRSAYLSSGGLDESLWNSMDYDLFCRLLAHAPVAYVEQPLVSFRYHEASKTVTSGDFFLRERLRASQRYWPGLVSEAEAREARRFTARSFTRRAVRRLLQGHVERSRQLFVEAWRLAPEAALGEPWLMSLGYVRRRLPFARASL